MLEVDGLPLSSLDEGLGHLTVLDDRILDTHLLLHEARQRRSRHIHSRQVLHTVTTMDVEYPTCWA